ncbi:hypothetical protein EV05_0953 [Prochlorococcus sp. MIT 0601]|nr:hypothetical protein EV05_0953 [Prochlorococcus sp. MIT 0601]
MDPWSLRRRLLSSEDSISIRKVFSFLQFSVHQAFIFKNELLIWSLEHD